MKPIIVTLLLLLFSSSLTIAQTTIADNGVVDGIVVDMENKAVPEATVYAISEQAMLNRPLTVAADKQGHFRFSGLADGSYFLDASKENEGYPYSFFSFYIMPGQDKPKVQVRQDYKLDNIVIKLGAKAAYLKFTLQSSGNESKPVQATFTRPDLPGFYKRSIQGGDKVAVPPVPFRLKMEREGEKAWVYKGENGSEFIDLKPGEELKLNVDLNPR